MDIQLDKRSTSSTLSSDAIAIMEYSNQSKSPVVGYLLWFFLGTLGVYRFYLGKKGSGAVMLIVSILSLIFIGFGLGAASANPNAGDAKALGAGVGLVGILGIMAMGIWWLVDAFLIPGMARSTNQALMERIKSSRRDV